MSDLPPGIRQMLFDATNQRLVPTIACCSTDTQPETPTAAEAAAGLVQRTGDEMRELAPSALKLSLRSRRAAKGGPSRFVREFGVNISCARSLLSA